MNYAQNYKVARSQANKSPMLRVIGNHLEVTAVSARMYRDHSWQQAERRNFYGRFSHQQHPR